ncbi:MAG: hypothetical protein F2658_04600 [Actinobacteria bacterium]|jgi:hypothetical protein|nr:hypothetical protein [Actinomycetota bacterium]
MKLTLSLTAVSIALITGIFIGRAEPINCEAIGKCQALTTADTRRSF